MPLFGFSKRYSHDRRDSISNRYKLMQVTSESEMGERSEWICEATSLEAAHDQLMSHYGLERIRDDGYIDTANKVRHNTLYTYPCYDDVILLKKCIEAGAVAFYEGSVKELEQAFSGAAITTDRAVYFYSGVVAYAGPNSTLWRVSMRPELVKQAIKRGPRTKVSEKEKRKARAFYRMPRSCELRHLITAMYDTVLDKIGGRDFIYNCADARYGPSVFVRQDKLGEAIPFIFKITKKVGIDLFGTKFVKKNLAYILDMWYSTETMIRRKTTCGHEPWHNAAYKMRPQLARMLKTALTIENIGRRSLGDYVVLWDDLVAKGSKFLNAKRNHVFGLGKKEKSHGVQKSGVAA